MGLCCIAGRVSDDPEEEDDNIHRRQRQHNSPRTEENDRR